MPDWRLKSDPVGGNVAIYSKVAPYTSTTPVAIATGTKAFEVAAGLPIAINDYLWAEPVGLAGEAFMVGRVVGYSGTTLTLDVARAVSSGTFSSWILTDHTPLYAPFKQASKQRLQFHTAAPSPSTTPALTRQVLFTIPALTFNNAAHRVYNGRFNLFAHGNANVPMVMGKILNLNGPGNHVGINGSTPVYLLANGFGTWLEIGSDGTNVIVDVLAILRSTETPRPAQAITVEFSIFDATVLGGLPGNNPSAPLMKHVLNNYVTLGRERIDTRKRYLRQTTGTPDFAISKDETLTIVGSGKTASPSYAQNEVGWRIRYACAGVIVQTTVGWNGSATNGGTRTADSVLVKK